MKYLILRKLDSANGYLLALAGMLAVAGPAAHTPSLRAQSLPPASQIGGQQSSVTTVDQQSVARSTVVPRWEAVAVRPCGAPTRRSIDVTPGRLSITCLSVMVLIRIAYDALQKTFPEDVNPVSGGPAWIKSDLYTIQAKAEGTPSAAEMHRPMLQAILEDRFKLKIRREMRSISVYELTVAKNGFKLQPRKGAGCISMDDLKPPPMDQVCNNTSRRTNPKDQGGALVTTEFRGSSLDQIAETLTGLLDRPVINKTGIPGSFDFHLEWGADVFTPGFNNPTDAPNGQSITTALQERMGLKLVPAKGSGTFYVIEGVERPSEN